MAIYRNVRITFWTDSKVVDDFTPEDKYFYLYLMTNPHTNLAGCYELSLKQASDETGYTKEVVCSLLNRLENVHEVIRYSNKTKEVLILNWSKFNWTKSKDFRKPLLREIEDVKSVEFKEFLMKTYDGADTVPRPSQDGVGTTVTVTDTDTDTDIGKGGMGEKPKPSKLKKEFENLWSLYPRKQGKEKAYRYYERARKDDTTYEEVEQGIRAYLLYIKETGVDMQFVKMGSTFFSQKGWQDDWSIRSRNKRSIDNVFAEIFEEHKDDV